jgi:membrane protein
MGIREPFRKYVTAHCPMMAASLSFFGFLSLLPLAMVAISVLGFVYGGTESGTDKVVRIVGGVMPAGVTEIRAAVESLFRMRGEIGILGLVVLLWSASSIFTNLQLAFDVIFGRTKNRGFWFRRLVAIAAVLGLAAVLVLFGLGVPFFQLFADWYAERFGQNLLARPWVIDAVSKTLSAVFAVFVFALIYRVLPRGEVKTRNAILTGVVFGILWELVRWGFGIYVRYGAGRAAIYGSLSSLLLLMLWIYVSSSILLLGASTLAVLERSRNGSQPA